MTQFRNRKHIGEIESSQYDYLVIQRNVVVVRMDYCINGVSREYDDQNT